VEITQLDGEGTSLVSSFSETGNGVFLRITQIERRHLLEQGVKAAFGPPLFRGLSVCLSPPLHGLSRRNKSQAKCEGLLLGLTSFAFT